MIVIQTPTLCPRRLVHLPRSSIQLKSNFKTLQLQWLEFGGLSMNSCSTSSKLTVTRSVLRRQLSNTASYGIRHVAALLSDSWTWTGFEKQTVPSSHQRVVSGTSAALKAKPFCWSVTGTRLLQETTPVRNNDKIWDTSPIYSECGATSNRRICSVRGSKRHTRPTVLCWTSPK